LTLMTFDTIGKVYRSWAFLATGTVIENEGVWDGITKLSPGAIALCPRPRQ
jgi:hypothetical protein